MMSDEFGEATHELGQMQSEDTNLGSPGTFLSARRQALGWTIEQVAEQIKLAPRQVHAIECDDYAALLPAVVRRGFIRAYAKCLDVDVTPLLAMVKSEVVPKHDIPPLRRAIPVNFSERRFPLMGNRNSVLSKWNVGVIFLILLLLSALLAQRMGWLPDLSKVTFSPATSRSESIPGGSSLVPVNEEKALQPKADRMGLAITSVLTQTLIPKAKEVPIASVDAASATPNDPAEKNQLVLQAHKDSWIEIKRANKSIAFSRILKAGEVEKFEMAEPVMLTIGNVAGVSVTLRGESLNAKAGINGNVARINLK